MKNNPHTSNIQSTVFLALLWNCASASNYYLHIPKTGGYGAFSQLKRDYGHHVCNHRVEPVSRWKSWGECWLHASESTQTNLADKQFVVVRKPHGHVLSQYFHCTESVPHRDRAHFMPSLNVWLESWVNASKHQKTLDQYHCYNPVNLQVPRICEFPNPTNELPQHFDVVGLTEDLFRSTCLISISLHHIVPPRCNCSIGRRSRRLRPNDHGVQHHGNTFKTTPEQTAIIFNRTFDIFFMIAEKNCIVALPCEFNF